MDTSTEPTEGKDVFMQHTIAIIGFGGMGSYHVKLLKNAGNFTLAGIWDIQEERREYARRQDIFVYDSLEHLLADKAYLEGIYRDGAQKAQYIARKTLSKVQKKIGFVAR